MDGDTIQQALAMKFTYFAFHFRIALETTYEGVEYLYWVNRITGKSSWFPPQS